MFRKITINNLFATITIMLIVSISGLTIVSSYAYGSNGELVSMSLNKLYMINGAQTEWEILMGKKKIYPTSLRANTLVDKDKIFTNDKRDILSLLHMSAKQGDLDISADFHSGVKIDFSANIVWFENVNYNTNRHSTRTDIVTLTFITQPSSFYYVYHAIMNDTPVEEQYLQVAQRVKELALECGIYEIKTDYDKAWKAYKTVVRTYEYNTKTEKKYNSVLGIIDQNTRCLGYAETFKLLCNMVGIECELVYGDTAEGKHAWNIVQIDGEWYQVDATYADTGKRSDAVFGGSDEFFSKTHNPD